MTKINAYTDCPKLLKDYLLYLHTIKGHSLRTVNGYYMDIRTFFRFLNLHYSLLTKECVFESIEITNIDLNILEKVTLSDVYEFLHYISSNRSNSPATRSRKVSSIRSFYNYLTKKMNLLEYNPMTEVEVPNIKKSLPKYLTLEQCLELLNHVDGHYKDRDYCIITLFLNCGMRLSELVGLNLSDINDNRIRLLGKGNKERIIYSNDACADAISRYLVYRNSNTINPNDKNALFLTRNGTRIGARRVQQIIDENLKKSGLDTYGFSTHKLRHTAATIMYQNGGVDIRILQEILGHANLGTTEIYTHISSTQLEKAAQSTPLAKIKSIQNTND